jgi:hypothetical protein
VRDVQPGPGADLDDPPAGAAQERTPPAAHACDLAQPEKRVVHKGENPQPRRRRRARVEDLQVLRQDAASEVKPEASGLWSAHETAHNR